MSGARAGSGRLAHAIVFTLTMTIAHRTQRVALAALVLFMRPPRRHPM